MKNFIFKYWIVGLLTGSLFLSSFYVYLPYFVVEVKNPIIMTAKELIEAKKTPYKGKPDQENILINSFDNTPISIRISYSQNQPAKAFIILLHGIRSDKEMLIPQEKFFTKHGFNTLSIDLRGHGQSGGEYCTYGFKEKRDVSAIIDFLKKKKKWKKKIGIFGHSLGGAIAIQALANDKRIDFGIIESSYSDFKKITSDYSEYYIGFSSELLQDDIVDRGAEIAGFEPANVNPKEYCKKIQQAVLIVHGTKDPKVKPQYAKENFRNLLSSKKELYLVNQAQHNDVWHIGGEKYHQKILEFIQKNID